MLIRAEYFHWAARFVVTPDDGTALARVIVQPREAGGAWIYAMNGERACIFADAAAEVDAQTCVLPVKGLVAACKLDKKKPGKMLRLHAGRLQVDQGNAAAPLYIEADPAASDPGGLVPPVGYPERLIEDVERIFSTPQSRPWIAVRPDAFAPFDFEGRGFRAEFATDGRCIRMTSAELPEFLGVVMTLKDAGAETATEDAFDPEDF